MPEPPRYFRPGTAFFDDVAVEITKTMGLLPVAFSVNGDGGATFPASAVAAEVSTAVAGDIVIAHSNHPRGGTADGIKAAGPVVRGRAEVSSLVRRRPAAASAAAPAEFERQWLGLLPLRRPSNRYVLQGWPSARC
jgi:hypothetical protein